MAKNSLELKDFVNDPTFIENMNRAFSDLRADYELSMDSTCEKINELKSLHVDVKNHLSDLTSWSRNSSGVISGLRGTGKTHLFMLARSALNSTLWDTENSHNLCIYLNLKRLCLPEQFDSDLFNRIFSVFIYDEVSKQLLQILSGLSEENKLKQFLSMFNTQKRKVKENLENVKVVGTKTYGKGVIQSIFTLSDGSGIKLTTNEYYTPNHNTINKVGITPDYEIEFPSGESIYSIDEEKDPQLQKAIELLK